MLAPKQRQRDQARRCCFTNDRRDDEDVEVRCATEGLSLSIVGPEAVIPPTNGRATSLGLWKRWVDGSEFHSAVDSLCVTVAGVEYSTVFCLLTSAHNGSTRIHFKNTAG